MTHTAMTFLLFGFALLSSALMLKLAGGTYHEHAVRKPKSAVEVRTPPPDEWQEQTVPDLRAAEDLLDCLEADGFDGREFAVRPDGTFVVRWQCRSTLA